LRDPVDERPAQPTPEPSSDHDRLEIEEVLRGGERDTQSPDRVVDQRHGHLVFLGEGLRDHAAGQAILALGFHDVEQGRLLPALDELASPGLDPTPARVGLEVTLAAVGTRPATGLHDRVADLAGSAPAVPELPVKDETAAHAGPDEHAQDVPVRTAGAAPMP